MPAFVKGPGAERRWAAAKRAAERAGAKDKYALANYIFHRGKSMKTERTERKGNPGAPKVTPQFPYGKAPSGAPFPFNQLEERWQPSMLSETVREEKFYDRRGDAVLLARRTPMDGGGDGKVVARTSDSVFAKRGG